MSVARMSVTIPTYIKELKRSIRGNCKETDLSSNNSIVDNKKAPCNILTLCSSRSCSLSPS